jgi:phosphotransferase system HPr-like phosphotransfer protein
MELIHTRTVNNVSRCSGNIKGPIERVPSEIKYLSRFIPLESSAVAALSGTDIRKMKLDLRNMAKSGTLNFDRDKCNAINSFIQEHAAETPCLAGLSAFNVRIGNNNKYAYIPVLFHNASLPPIDMDLLLFAAGAWKPLPFFGYRQRVSCIFKLRFLNGLHSSPSLAITTKAYEFISNIGITDMNSGRRANAKEFTDILANVSSSKGSRLRVDVSGVDAKEAFIAMSNIFNDPYFIDH